MYVKLQNDTAISVERERAQEYILQMLAGQENHGRNLVYAKKKAIRSLRLASIRGAAEVLSTAAGNDDEEEDEYKEDDNYNEAGDSEDEVKCYGNADSEEVNKDRNRKETTALLKSTLLANVESLRLGDSIVFTEFLIFINSSFINLIYRKQRVAQVNHSTKDIARRYKRMYYK
ncbi:unnamed protein product [Mucor hiemalis]